LTSLVIGFNINSIIPSCIDVTTATAALFANTLLSSVVAAGKFKVATPDVSAPVLYFYNPPRNRRTIWRAKHIKVKAFSTSHS
jgi:hypothetical protein